MKIYTLPLFALLTLLCLQPAAVAQGFTNINAGLSGLHWSDVAWGDYDGDGDLDVIIAGLDSGDTAVTKIYKNIGNDNFSELIGLPIPGTYIGDFVWGDYDGDGDLDILIQGYTASSQITKIYKNIGDDNFVDSGLIFPALADGSVCFADYNNNGYLDILIAGYSGSGYVASIYRNNGDATYTDSGIPLPGAIKSAYEWGDYDNDGDLDLFITGLDGGGTLISKLFENNGDDTFSETSNAFVGAWLGDVAWGDYDSDGYLDILLSGFTASGARVAKVYRNNGDGTFTEQTDAGLTGVSHCSTIWGDYDHDGDLDVFIGGTYEQGGTWIRVTDVFINNGNHTFTAAGLSFSVNVFWGESAWGDYDADGDLDLICCGHDDAGSSTMIYRNNAFSPNTIPQSPGNLQAYVAGEEVLLSWDVATDNETPAAGLTYNAYIRNEFGEIIWNAMSLSADGYRLLPALGNAQQNSGWTIRDLAFGSYFWSVQAVDNNFAGSLFAEEGTFTISSTGIEEDEFAENLVSLSNSPNPFHTATNIAFQTEVGGFVQIDIFNVNGRLINSLVKQNKSAGAHSVAWSGVTDLGHPAGSGLYYYTLKIDNRLYSVKKCLLLE